jgi:hypothetical protein
VQHSFQTHPHFQSHHEEHLEEPSKIHQQTLNPFAYYSAICHLQDIERPISARVENNETDDPMFQLLVNFIKDSKLSNSLKLLEEPNEIIAQTRLASIVSFDQRWENKVKQSAILLKEWHESKLQYPTELSIILDSLQGALTSLVTPLIKKTKKNTNLVTPFFQSSAQVNTWVTICHRKSNFTNRG